MSETRICLTIAGLLFKVFLLADSIAFGQCYPIEAQSQLCTTVLCRTFKASGSSFCVGEIDGDKVFVTAGHLFGTADPLITSFKSEWIRVGIDGKWVDAKYVASSGPQSPNDFGFVTIQTTQAIKMLPVAESIPAVGVDVVVHGYPSGGKYNLSYGTIGSLINGDRTRDFQVIPAVVQGVSGGPVICDGKVVGVVSTSDFSDGTQVVGPVRLRQSLMKVFKRIPGIGAEAGWDGYHKRPDGSVIELKRVSDKEIEWPQRAETIHLEMYGATWCDPCKSMKPTVQQLEAEGVVVHFIDVDEEPDSVRRYNIKSIPAFVAWNGNIQSGIPHQQLSGVVPIERLRELVNSVRRKASGVIGRLPIVTDPDCGKPRPAPTQPQPDVAPIEAEKPPAVEPPPAPQTPPQVIHGRDGKDGKDGAPGLPGAPGKDADPKAIAELKAKIEAFIALFPVDPETKKPVIPVELFDESTGEKIDTRLVPLGQPIQLGNRSKKVK